MGGVSSLEELVGVDRVHVMSAAGEGVGDPHDVSAEGGLKRLNLRWGPGLTSQKAGITAGLRWPGRW